MILAQSLTRSPEHFKGVRQRFERAEPGMAGDVLLFFSLAVSLILLMWVYARIQQARSRPVRPQPMSLYLRLQRQLHLPFRTRYRLWLLARKLKIEQPAALLISSDLFDEAVERYRSKGSISAGAQAAFVAARAQLFPAG